MGPEVENVVVFTVRITLYGLLTLSTSSLPWPFVTHIQRHSSSSSNNNITWYRRWQLLPSAQRQAVISCIASVGVGQERTRRQRFTPQQLPVVGDQTNTNTNTNSWRGGHIPPMLRHTSRRRRREAVRQ